MSTSTKSTSPAAVTSSPSEVKVVSHTGLFYWWPVWFAGLILSLLTAMSNGRMAIVPKGTQIKSLGENVVELTLPQGSAALDQARQATASGQDPFPIRMSGNRDYGMVFVTVLLLVVFGTNIPLRGLSSLAAMLAVFVLAMLLAYFDMWGWIFERLGGLHVEISLAGYLVPSCVLLVLWLVTVFGFDQMRYVRFTPGQFVLHRQIGDAAEVHDAKGVAFERHRNDLFRHWILGLGAGDLVLTLPQGREIVLPNVAFVGRKVPQIADLMKTREVTAS
jgi:hypothetical protein